MHERRRECRGRRGRRARRGGGDAPSSGDPASALLRDAEAWLDAEIGAVDAARAAEASRVSARMLGGRGGSTAAYSSAVFDARLSAATPEMHTVTAVLPGRPSPGVVDVSLDTLGGVLAEENRGSACARELSVYDQQQSTLTSGKSGREGGVATQLEFLPGGLARSMKKVVTQLASAEPGAVSEKHDSWTRLDEIALGDPLPSALTMSDSDAEKLAAAGLAPGLSKGLSVKDVQKYLTSLHDDKPVDGPPKAAEDAFLDADTAADAGDGALNRNSPQLLGRYNGAIQDPEFNESVRANLRWEGNKEAENRAGDTASFSNIFADLDEEEYLLGNSSSDSSSGSDDEHGVDDEDEDETRDPGDVKVSVQAAPTERNEGESSSSEVNDLDEISALLLESQLKLQTKTVSPFSSGSARWKGTGTTSAAANSPGSSSTATSQQARR